MGLGVLSSAVKILSGLEVAACSLLQYEVEAQSYAPPSDCYVRTDLVIKLESLASILVLFVVISDALITQGV